MDENIETMIRSEVIDELRDELKSRLGDIVNSFRVKEVKQSISLHNFFEVDMVFYNRFMISLPIPDDLYRDTYKRSLAAAMLGMHYVIEENILQSYNTIATNEMVTTMTIAGTDTKIIPVPHLDDNIILASYNTCMKLMTP